MRITVPAVLAYCTLVSSSVAQDPELQIQDLPGASRYAERLQRGVAPGSSKLEAVKVQKSLRAAFIIEPLVHKVTARRGQLLKFQFRIAANAKRSRLQISPVAMIQQESGSILPDRDSIAPDVLRIVSAKEVDLALAESHTIECEMRVPPVNSPFLSFGVLVRELPTDLKPGTDPNKPQIGIRFLTQYLLRVDLEILGVTGDSVSNIAIQNGQMIEEGGNAVIRAFIENPTDTSMTFQMRSELVSVDTGKRYRSFLGMPTRAGLEPPRRYESRILGNTRLRMEGRLQDSVFPGSYELHMEIVSRGRTYSKATFPLTIRSGDFPAQDATIVRVARDIAVEPSHVELSLRKGGNRLQSLTIENGSQQTIIAELTPKSYIGDLADWISFRPDRLELAPGRKRKVLVTLGSKRTFVTHNYAFAELSVRPETGRAIGTQDIPIALLTNSEAAPEIEMGDLAWKAQSSNVGFEVPLQNVGGRHLELLGRLTLRDQFGRGFSLDDGYGRWILPGHDGKLWFRFPQMPPPGTYDVVVEVSRGENVEPVQLKQTIQLKNAAERVSEGPSDSRPQ